MRTAVAGAFLAVGIVLFDWWIALPWLVPREGMYDRLISDATATGSPHAMLIRTFEVVGALALLVALLLRGPLDEFGIGRRDWWCTVGLVVFEVFGAVFVESCPSGTDRACFDREIALDLDLHHYLHIAGGVVEWSFALLAAWFGWRRLRGTGRGRIYGGLLVYAGIVLVPLALAFATHRLFAVVEFTVYLAFSTILVLVVTERSVPAPAPHPVR